MPALRAFQAAILLLLLHVVLGLSPARAEGKHASIVLDANTGEVVYATAADEPRYPASLTKMMTLYLAFEQIEQGRLSYASKIKISQEAASAAPSKLDLDPGEEISLGDAIRALVTKSANDVAVAIGEHIAGSEGKFAQIMTERARQIGMRNTTFRNASGLPDLGQVTTARDMITLALRLHDDFPKHYAVFSTRVFSFNGSSHRNHNNMLFNYQGTEGIKTGYTRASGFNVVVSVKREGKHVMAAVFGGTTASARDVHMRALLNRTVPRASTQRTRRIEPILVARAKPVPTPRPAQRAKPVTVAHAAPNAVPPALAPARAPAAAAAAAPRPVAPAERDVKPAAVEPLAEAGVATATAGAEAAAAPPAIAVAQVRRVMVPQRPRQGRSAGTTDEENPQPVVSASLRGTAAEHSEQAEPAVALAAAPAEAAAPTAFEPFRSRRGDLYAAAERGADARGERAPMARAPLESTETAIVKAPARQPSTLAAQPLALSAAPPPAVPSGRAPRAIITTAGAVAAPQPAASAPPTGPVSPGKRPSTLQEQARAMERGDAAAPPPAQSVRVAARTEPAADPGPTYRLRGPEQAAIPAVVAAAPVSSAGGFHIQVGAYATQAEAERQIALVRQRAGAVLAAAAPAMIPVQKGNRQLIRARFTGLDANKAASACMELRREQIDCFVMRAD